MAIKRAPNTFKSHRLAQNAQNVSLDPNSLATPAIEMALRQYDAGNLDESLRYLDRAWRMDVISAAQTVVGPLLGRLLLEHAKHPLAAVYVLSQTLNHQSGKETEALLTRALIASSQLDQALIRLESALRRHRLVRGDDLSATATELTHKLDRVGWIGWGGPSTCIGALASGGLGKIRLRDGISPRPLATFSANENGDFSFSLAPAWQSHPVLIFESDTKPLLGSGQAGITDFGFGGRAERSLTRVSGWASLSWDAALAPTLRISADNKEAVIIEGSSLQAQGARHGFDMALPRSLAPCSALTVAAQMPDGRWVDFPDSPMISPRALSLPVARKSRKTARKSTRKVDVIIPVYRGLDETLACIRSVLDNQRPNGDLIVIEDASPDPKMRNALVRLARSHRFTLLRNEKNLGFARTVNLGIALHHDRDVLILNSDTLVHGNWISRLRQAAYSGVDVGTVTPLTNDGSIASYPRKESWAATPQEISDLDSLTLQANTGRVIDIPVGVGFCQYWRRDCLDDVGELDTAIFGTGYGEETDLCLRAGRAGWRHVLAADVFVGHSGGMSFGSRRQILLERSERLLRMRHPAFAGMVEKLERDDPVRPARCALLLAQLSQSNLKFVLLVTHDRKGGVETYIQRRRQEIARTGAASIVLRAGKSADHFVLETDAFKSGRAVFEVRTQLGPLLACLDDLNLSHCEIHHFIDLDPRVVEALLAAGIPSDFYIHDYVWYCPQVTLIDGSGEYCGEPALKACEACVRKNKPALQEKITVAALRSRSTRWLKAARAAFVPSKDVQTRLHSHFPEVLTTLKPWETPTRLPSPVRQVLRQRIRVALLGAIGRHKGYQRLLACALDAARRDLPLEFVVIGYTQNDGPLLKTGRAFVTGPYDDAEIAALVQREQPHLILLPSVWPETWSFTLSHAFTIGLPVAAFDLGTMAERIRQAGHGTLLPLSLTASSLNDELIRIACGQ